MITAPELLQALREHIENIAPQPDTMLKPRASHLTDCARKIAYEMRGTPVSNPHGDDPDKIDQVLSNEENRWAEELTIAGLNQKGIWVVERQAELPDDLPVTGHIDGELRRDGVSELVRWGFEHKRYGYFSYEKIFRHGLAEGAPEVVAQVVVYGAGRKWDRCLVVITSSDASAIRRDRNQSLRYKTPEARWGDLPDFNAKVQIIDLDLKPYRALWQPILMYRAEWMTEHAGLEPRMIAREADPERDKFPCTWCEYRDTCINDGPGTLQAPGLPFAREVGDRSAWLG